jgi:hypothetical protein
MMKGIAAISGSCFFVHPCRLVFHSKGDLSAPFHYLRDGILSFFHAPSRGVDGERPFSQSDELYGAVVFAPAF